MDKIQKITPYLSHGVGVLQGNRNNKKLFTLDGLNLKYFQWKEKGGYSEDYIDNCILILRPLSDLTKEIEVNGKRFVPINCIIEEFCEKYTLYKGSIHTSLVSKNDTVLMFIDNKIADECPVGIYNQLLKWHFDVFGMIESGEAIDINTI